jgi:hypothetical protein
VNQSYNPLQLALANIGEYARITNDGKYRVGDREMTAEEFETWAGTQIMTQGIKNQSQANFSIASQLASGKSLSDVIVKYGRAPEMVPYQEGDMIKYRETGGEKTLKYGEYLQERILQYSDILAELEKDMANAANSAERQGQLFEQYQAVNQAYWQDQQAAMDLEAEQIEKDKARKQKRQDDLLSSVFTSLAELKVQGGKEVLLVIGGTPDADARIQEYLAILDGQDPELAAIARKAFESTQVPRLR